MNPNYIHTITVFNCLKAADNPGSMEDTWQKTVLHDCFYKNVMGRVDSEKGSKMSSVYTARIPESSSYRSYSEWASLPQDERKNLFTFNLGDIVVKGECADDIKGFSPFTASELLEKYKPDAFKVTAFSDNASHIAGRHYRVGG